MSTHSDGKVKVGLVTCDKWINRVYDDLLLQNSFLKNGIKADIISWQDTNNNLRDYNALIITSMWGYQNYIEDLDLWFRKINNLKVFNSIDLIKNNYNKIAQIEILRKNHLPFVPTTIIGKNTLKGDDIAFQNFPIVIKPSISSGGENTFLVRNKDELKKIEGIIKRINCNCGILIQPFMPEIRHGEISVIVIDKKIVNAVIRFPEVLDTKGQYKVKLLQINKLDSNLISLCKKVIALRDYDEHLYMRIDVVKKENSYIIMEVELFEPQLFYYLLKGKKRKSMLESMVKSTKKRL